MVARIVNDALHVAEYPGDTVSGGSVGCQDRESDPAGV